MPSKPNGLFAAVQKFQELLSLTCLALALVAVTLAAPNSGTESQGGGSKGKPKVQTDVSIHSNRT